MSDNADVELLNGSELFDAEFYLGTQPPLPDSVKNPARHYLRKGWREGRDPSRAFSTSGYLLAYGDIAASGANPLVHYLRFGKDEGRLPDPMSADIDLVAESGLFDEDYYAHFRPEAGRGADAIRDYILTANETEIDPSEAFSTSRYLVQNPDVEPGNPLVHYLRYGRPEGRLAPRGKLLKPYFDLVYTQRWPELAALHVTSMPDQARRVTVLTDSVGSSSLFGGVGTALILGIQLANALGGALRIATRTDAPDPRVVGTLEQAAGVRLAGPLEVIHLPLHEPEQLSVGEQDVVITTSWWTTRALLDSTFPRERIVYLLQEDERMFYPYGDERLLCTETIAERGFPVVVNTQRLLTHLAQPGPFEHLAEDGLSFEPAFPGLTPAGEPAPVPSVPQAGDKKNFFFYSRPGNSRNLFWRGATAIARAIENGALDPDEWTIHMVGRLTPDITFPRDVHPVIVEGLDWLDYQRLVRTMHGALVLMDTPHPSYPPLDLAACGAAVLTNTHPGKEDLTGVSRNIMSVAPDVDSLVDGMRHMVTLARDADERASRLASDAIATNWPDTLAPAVSALLDRLPVTSAHVR